MIGGVVLAAGRSRRMGANKLFIEFDGEPLVTRTVRRAVEAGLNPVTVVLGPDSGAAQEALSSFTINVVVNSSPADAPHDSLRLGLNSLPARTKAAVVLLADMPLVTTHMLAALVAAWTPDSPLVAGRYGGTLAPPALFRRDLFQPAARIDQGSVVSAMVDAVGPAARFVEWPAEWLADLDTPEDIERVRKLLPRS